MKPNQYVMRSISPRHQDEDGEVQFSGMATGRMTIHAKNNGHIIIKEEGHKYWSAIGQQSYAPAQFRVVRVLSEVDKGYADGLTKVEQITEFPVRSQS